MPYLEKMAKMIVLFSSEFIFNYEYRECINCPVRSILLDAEILIVEHLYNLYLFSNDGFTFGAIPPKFKVAGTFSIRTIAKLIIEK